jgi:acyl-CoA reductase-like NAD-dependent aldehyde dehydrogenase
MNNQLKVYSPYDRKPIGDLPLASEAELEQKIKTAHALFQDKNSWIPAHKRITLLEKVRTLMENKVEELTNTAAQEGGKPYQDSKVEVKRAINGVKIATEEISHMKGGQIPMGITESSVNRLAFTIREPIHCSNELSEKLVSDPRINFLSFIGSARVGWSLKSKMAPGTRCALEHGGAAPVIVEPDAVMEEMLPLLVKGGFYHAGQVCVSVQKVFAHRSIAEKLAKDIAESAKKLKVGDPLAKDTEVGPLIQPGEVDRVDEWVKEAIDGGAKLLCGGKKISDTCYEPTVLLNPSNEARVSKEEIFGPVVCVYAYDDRNEAIALANSLEFHFQAAVFTKDLDIALDTVQKLNATAVMVNDHTAFRVDWMPFGGRDVSGEGMGGIPYSMHEMTREKLMVFKSKLLP